jgi:uncharacterized membrane protein
MANYYIIGGDGREYGPITADEVRKWAGEGRLNEQTSAKAESDAEWRPLSKFPEFADIFGGESGSAATEPPGLTGSPGTWQEGDYDLDLWGSFVRGWELLKNNFGVLFVGPLIYFLFEIFVGLLSSIPVVGHAFRLVNLVLTGPLMAGVFYQFILVNRGEKTAVGDIFGGFRRRFIHLVLGYLVVTVFSLLCFAPVIILYGAKLLAIMHQAQSVGSDQAAAAEMMKNFLGVMLSGLPWILVCMIPSIYVSVSFIFTLPLIIDKDLDFWPAMQASRRMVAKHWWLLFGMLVLVGLVSMVGIFGCCIGILFTIPIGYGALMSAYETIFGKPQKS